MAILSFDVEEWFHLLHGRPRDWNDYPSRLDYGIKSILDYLASLQIHATFFCLGWVADKHPDLIKSISNQGHEIGSHSYMHQPVGLDSKAFGSDLKRSIDCLQQITGRKITSFRAPGFSINDDNLWAFEKLIENGIDTDSSIVNASFHAYGGVRTLKLSGPTLLNVKGHLLKEFPIISKNLLLLKMMYSGGGYFRLFPYRLIKRWSRQSDYLMAYFHYRDFDADQPMLESMSMARRFQSYYGISSAFRKFQAYVNDFKFCSIASASSQIDWSAVPYYSFTELQESSQIFPPDMQQTRLCEY